MNLFSAPSPLPLASLGTRPAFTTKLTNRIFPFLQQQENVSSTISKIDREFFKSKCQALLINGRTAYAQAIKVHSDTSLENIVSVSFRLIDEAGTAVFTALTSSRQNTVQTGSILPIYYNPEDYAVVIIL